MARRVRRISATEFKAKCLELMDRVAGRRESFVITKRGRPVARMVPMDPEPRDDIFGWLRGQAWDRGDVVAPAVPARDWNIVKEWDELNVGGPARRSRRRGKPGRKSE